MRLTLIHLTDIHFSQYGENPLLRKQESLIKAIVSEGRKARHIIFCVTGDIANFGFEDEYINFGIPFFELLRDEITSQLDDTTCDFLFIPGNHDCNLSDNESMAMRDELIRSLASNPTLANNSKLIKTIKEQDAFDQFKFYFHEEWKICKLEKSNELLEVVGCTVNGKKIILNLFNSSWISTKSEKPGHMYFPTSYVENIISEDIGDINISLIHHPDHWLYPMNKREMETLLQSKSDFILSGHEHVPTTVTVTDWSTRAVHFIEGAALQERGNALESGFNVIHFNIDHDVTYAVKNYFWNSTYYEIKEEEKWVPLVKSLSAKTFDSSTLMIKPEFEENLNDIGIPISHPRLHNIKLKDIYVYPNVEEIIYQDDAELLSSPQDIPELLNQDKESHFLFTGDKDSGKTALAKTLFNYYYGEKYFPLLIQGLDVTQSTFRNIDRLIKRTFEKVYPGEKHTQYLQLNSDERILIIDDWHKSNINSEAKSRFISEANKYFKQIVFLSELNNTIKDTIELSSTDGDYKFRHFEIMNIGHVKRDEFIEKWITIGQRETLENAQLLREIDRINRIMKPILMQSFVPRYPLYLLIILKTIESGTQHNLDKSSNGYYFEILIKDSLSDIKIENNETDKIYQYLTEFAYELLKTEDYILTLDQWRSFHKRHLDYYDMNDDQIVFKEIQEKLVKEKVIKNVTTGYEFYYPYVYYFFVAQYLARNIGETEVREKVTDMCENINNTDYANIIMFLTHLSKDTFIKDQVIKAAQKIFWDIEPLKLEDDINIINELSEELSPLVIQDINVREHRKKLNEAKDELERSGKDSSRLDFTFEQVAADIEEDEEKTALNQVMETVESLNKGFKMLDIIGQILKNYYGSMSGTNKQELCEELFKLGLRINHSVITDLLEQNEPLVKYIGNLIGEKEVDSTSGRAEKIAKRVIYSIGGLITFNSIGKTAFSVGTPDLDRTFIRVKEKIPFNSVELIHLMIKLEYYDEFPYTEVSRFYEKNKHNKVATQIIQQMVKRYLYMYETSRSEKQRLCAIVGIQISPRMMLQLQKQK